VGLKEFCCHKEGLIERKRAQLQSIAQAQFSNFS